MNAAVDIGRATLYRIGMPTLDWIGKKAVLNHHRQVPYHLLRCDEKLSVGDPGSGNLLVEGDNLLALKALLPYYAGQVKCIYIDPPYNTGNENWVYNDAVNSPEIRQWLGKVVGAEAEDLSRHDKWLCMMFPRLTLLREFLGQDGAIFVSIDDEEMWTLRAIMDDIFGRRNFIATIVWEKSYTPNQTAKFISDNHDYLLAYARNADNYRMGKLGRSNEQEAKFKNPDNDPRGPWKAENLSAGKFYSTGQFQITGQTGKVFTPPPGRYWRCNEGQYEKWLADGRIWFGKQSTGRPMLKKFLNEMTGGLTPSTWWKHEDFGTNKEASSELKSLFEGQSRFPTPKPVRLLRRLFEIATEKDSLVLDSFAGSGTTGHAVSVLNAADGGQRRFILVEQEERICQDVTSARLKGVGNTLAVEDSTETGGKPVGISFRYCTLAEPLFDETGNIRPEVEFADLAAHVYFTETGEPIPKRANGKTPLIGQCKGTAYYLLFNGILGDKRPDGGNVLTGKTLGQLPAHDGPKVVYGEGCRLGGARLKRENIVFKQVPYEIKVS